jgi:tyrosine-specific transport protein
MYKKIGAVFLVAGTCIGSGMIALPMVLAKLGLAPSMLLMLAIWFIMYYTSLINLELNLQAKHGLSLGELGRRFSGKTAELIGTISLKLLSYSLLAVFIYGGASILQELIESKMGVHYSFESIASWYALVVIGLLLLPIKLIDYFNRLLFISLLGVVILLIAGLVVSIEWSHLPLFSEKYTELSTWAAVIPVVFTSFGFQVIFHSLTNYCHKDAKMLKNAFFWGSLIPAIVYILWTCSILSVVYHNNPSFYVQMAEGKTEVGELIEALSSVAKWHAVQLLVWWISLLAIATSVLGVGVGLCDSLKKMMHERIPQVHLRNFLASFLTIFPAYLAVIWIPNAFIAVLGFAGMILAVIAIILPTWLFWQIKPLKLHYEELKTNWMIWLSFAAAIGVIACELWNMLAR